ncbi:hypothetical protein Q7P35_000651 [Cladosporium inversicolor]
MAAGKKAKRGGTAKLKKALSVRNTAFIETSEGSKRVFPREVCNNIYSYLLLGCNVKKERDSELWNAKGWAYHYCFEVNILRANKAIYAEARKVLYGANTFVVLSTKEHEICYRFKFHAIPVVSEDSSAVDRFSEHSLYMRMEAHTERVPRVRNVIASTAERRPPKNAGSCCPMTYLLSFSSAVSSTTWTQIRPFYRRLCEKRKPATTLIRFQNNTYGSTTSSFVENALTKLRKVAGDREVEIIAPSHPWLATECKETMTPKVAWGYAIAWDLLEVARELKVAADESWTLLNLDLAVASIVLNLFSGTDENATSQMLDAWKFMLQSHRVPDETRARAHHAMAFVEVNNGNCRGALDSLKKAETHREMAGLDPDPGLSQDIAKQVKHMKVCSPQDFDHQLTEENLKAMGLTRKDVPPRLHARAEACLDPTEQLEAMDLST